MKLWRDKMENTGDMRQMTQVGRQSELPSIVARGRKGGSSIAVAIIHALLTLSAKGS